MDPKFFVDAAGIPRVVTPDNPLQKLQGIAEKFGDAVDPLDLGSATRNNKVNNIRQINQYRKLVPTPYDIRMQQQAKGMNLPGGGRTPRIPAPGMGLPFDTRLDPPKAAPAPTPQVAPGSTAPKTTLNRPASPPPKGPGLGL